MRLAAIPSPRQSALANCRATCRHIRSRPGGADRRPVMLQIEVLPSGEAGRVEIAKRAATNRLTKPHAMPRNCGVSARRRKPASQSPTRCASPTASYCSRRSKSPACHRPAARYSHPSICHFPYGAKGSCAAYMRQSALRSIFQRLLRLLCPVRAVGCCCQNKLVAGTMGIATPHLSCWLCM